MSQLWETSKGLFAISTAQPSSGQVQRTFLIDLKQHKIMLGTSLAAAPWRRVPMHSQSLGGGGRRLPVGTEGATTQAAHHGVEPGAVGLPADRPRRSK